MKTKTQRGFTAVEGLIVLLVVVTLGGAGYYVWNKNNKPAPMNTTTAASLPQAYKRTTTVPAGWKIYSDAAYNFSFSYEPTWTVTSVASSALTASPNQVAEVDLSSLSPAKSKGTLTGDGLTISVFKQSLAKTLAYEKAVLQSAQQQTANAGKPLKITTTDITYDANTAVKYVSYSSQDATSETTYLIYHDGYSYNISLISSNSDKTNPISKNTLTAFESLKFQTIAGQTATQKYLTIKEWGVRVPMPGTVATADIYYQLKTDSLTKSPEAVLGSTKLGALVANCDIKSTTGATPFGWIERMAPTEYTKAKADAVNTGVKSGTLLKGYYYVWQVPRGNCFETTADGNSKLMAQISALSSSKDQLVDNFPTDMTTVLKSVQLIP